MFLMFFLHLQINVFNIYSCDVDLWPWPQIKWNLAQMLDIHAKFYDNWIFYFKRNYNDRHERTREPTNKQTNTSDHNISSRR